MQRYFRNKSKYKVMGDIKEEISDLLKRSQYGMSIKKIADKLKYSRTTITKYLRMLEAENAIFPQEIGQYKIWRHQESAMFFGSTKSEGQKFVMTAYSLLLKYLSLLHPEIKDGKEIGKLIIKDLDIDDLIGSDINETILSFDFTTLEPLAQLIMTLLDNIYSTWDTYTFDPPIINETNPRFFILRMRDSDFFDYFINFELLTGFIEGKFEQYHVPIKAEVNAIHEKERIVDIKISLDE